MINHSVLALNSKNNSTFLGDYQCNQIDKKVDGIAQIFLKKLHNLFYFVVMTTLKPIDWVVPRVYVAIDSFFKPELASAEPNVVKSPSKQTPPQQQNPVVRQKNKPVETKELTPQPTNMYSLAAKAGAVFVVFGGIYSALQNGFLPTEGVSEFLSNVQNTTTSLLQPFYGETTSQTPTLEEEFAQSSLDHFSFIPEFIPTPSSSKTEAVLTQTLEELFAQSTSESTSIVPKYTPTVLQDSDVSILGRLSSAKNQAVDFVTRHALVLCSMFVGGVVLRDQYELYSMKKIQPTEPNLEELKKEALDYCAQLMTDKTKTAKFYGGLGLPLRQPMTDEIGKLRTLLNNKLDQFELLLFPKQFRENNKNEFSKYTLLQEPNEKNAMLQKLITKYTSSLPEKGVVYNPWENPESELLELADEMMKLSYGITHYTLLDWDQTVKENDNNYQEAFKDNTGYTDKETLTRVFTSQFFGYFYRTFFLNSMIYKDLRLHSSYTPIVPGRTFPKIEGGVDHEKRKKENPRGSVAYLDHKLIQKTFYTLGTKQSKWRMLYNSIIDETAKRFDLTSLKKADQRFVEAYHKDESFETAAQHGWNGYPN